MSEPRALDLFCGAGGASMGLHRAGFGIVGIDIRPQPRYPFRFIQADALRLPVRLEDFDFVWASPDCLRWAAGTRDPGVWPDLITPLRPLLEQSGVPWVMENVWGAPLRRDLILDGTMFAGLRVIRRRIFELSASMRSALIMVPPSGAFPGMVRRHGWTTVVGGGRCSGTPRSASGWHTEAAKRAAMGIEWMDRASLAQAVPPPYAEFIGRAALSGMAEAIRRLA